MRIRGKCCYSLYPNHLVALRTDDSPNKIGRRGVEAIFTAGGPKRDMRFAIGILVILAGIFLWLTAALHSDFPGLFATSEIGAYLSILLNSLGLILVMTGVGICLSFSVFDRTDFKEASLAEEVPADRRASPNRPRDVRNVFTGGLITRNFGFGFGLVVFFQSCVVLALYSGLVDEYQSNPSMQLWIRSNLPIGQYFLNLLTALVIAAALGLLVIQFLPERPFAK